MIRACYRAAIASGYSADCLLWLMPRSESLDDPPLGADIQTVVEARARLRQGISTRNLRDSLCASLKDPPRPGYFYVVGSKAEGRFKGTFVGMLPIPHADEKLPPSLSLMPPVPPHERN
jgi:hypothetical protein